MTHIRGDEIVGWHPCTATLIRKHGLPLFLDFRQVIDEETRVLTGSSAQEGAHRVSQISYVNCVRA